MKRIFIILLFFNIPFFALSQIKSEHILSYSKLINPAFSKNASQINASFDKNSIIGNESDAKYFVKFEISEKKAELSGSSANFNIGSAVAGLGNLVSGLLSIGQDSPIDKLEKMAKQLHDN